MNNNEMREKALFALKIGIVSLRRSPDIHELIFRFGTLNGELNALHNFELIDHTEYNYYLNMIHEAYNETEKELKKEKPGN